MTKHTFKNQKKIMIGNQILDKPEPREKSYCAETLWSKYEKLTDKQKEETKSSLLLLLLFVSLLAQILRR